MITTSEAKKIIQENIQALPPVDLPLHEANGLILAADVFAVTDIPAFAQSSMDGYALSFNGWKLHQQLIIDGEIAAGSHQSLKVGTQNAVRIFTGAAVPDGADTVVMQEKVRVEQNKLMIEDDLLQPGTNVRPQGSEIKAGALALSKGNRLSPAAIGFLAGIGTTSVKVDPHPSVTIIVTGNELQQPGSPLEHGKVYESNSFSLTAALQQLHILNVNVMRAPDDPHALTDALGRALQSTDLVLSTGGISVGDYDLALQAANRNNVLPLFHKVKQRPGKPLFFGMKEKKPVFGLPGNPSSVLTCFYMYVLTALEKMCGHSFGLHTIQAPLSKSYHKLSGLTHFLKGIYDGKTVAPLDAQESYRMHSFARANCLIEIGESIRECKAGTVVDVHLLPE